MSQSSACLADDKLIALAEGCLPSGEQADAEAHLDLCAACRAHLEWIKQHLLGRLARDGERAPTLRDDAELTDQREVLTRTFAGPAESTVLLPDIVKTQGTIGKQGEYRIARVLGCGAYGVVLESLDTLLNRPVAIKVLMRDLANRETSRRRFIREARAGAAINHPNVVTIYGVDEADQVPFLIMELIRGESLRERIHREPKLDIIDIIRISAQIAQGLAAAHAQGVIHRDVKPGNIMLVDDLPRVKITDFGLARVSVEDVEFTSRGLAVGTPAYMSPEQVRGEEVDTRSDLFALGCVIYAMVTGHSPYYGQNTLEVAHRIDTFMPPRLTDVDKRVPDFLSSIVERLLQKDRDRRYQSAAEVADVLNRHLAILNQTPTDRLPEALKTPLLERNSGSRRSPWIAGIAAATVFALIAITAATQFFGGGGQAGTGGGGNGAQNGQDPTPPPPIPISERRSEVTVSQAGDGDVATIAEALRLVAPSGVIRIRGSGEYQERILLDDAQAYDGLRIEAEEGATLRSDRGSVVVTVHGVPRVNLRGLKIIAPQIQPGIEVNGACPGLTIEDVTIEHIDNADGSLRGNGALNLRKGATGTPEEPIVVRGARLIDTVVGIVIGNPTVDDPPTANIVVEECLVVGRSSTNSTLLALLKGCEDVSVRRSSFSRGHMGLSLLAEGDAAPRNCDISHNTWHDVNNWIVWTGPVPSPAMLRIHDNLIVESLMISNEQARALVASVGNPSVFMHNSVFNAAHSARGFEQVAEILADLPLLSLDPSHIDFLRPDFSRLQGMRIPGRYPAPDAPD